MQTHFLWYQPHYSTAMAKDMYLTALLTLLLRAILDDTLPPQTELDLLLVFILSAETAERIHSTYFTDALSDWVTRLMKGIEAATFTPSLNKCRTLWNDTEAPSQYRPTPSSSFIALLNDAVGGTTVAITTPSTEPRFAIQTINSHGYDEDGRLSFNVQWALEGSQDTQEPFANLHHLDALNTYEQSIRTTLGTGAAAASWNVYQLQKGVELLELVSEDDTDSDASETLDPASLELDLDQYLLDMPMSTMLDMSQLPPMPISSGSSADIWGDGVWDEEWRMNHLGSILP
jgi:hypothetical protein